MKRSRAGETGKELRVLDLFCGCGGLSHGLSMAEYQGYTFKVVAGLDFNKASIETFKLNHPDAKAFCLDIKKADIDSIVDEIGEIDVIVGGPSCQGFSTHGKRLADDPRNFLYKYYLQFVAQIRPKWSIIENVTGLLRYQSGRFRDEIVGDLARLGYAVSFAQLQAADYGVPQIRKRVFFVANRENTPFVFPAPTHGPFELGEFPLDNSRTIYPFTSLAEAIGDLPLLGTGSTSSEAPSEYAAEPLSAYQAWSRRSVNALKMHYCAPPPAQNLDRIRHIPPGGDWLDIPAELLPARFSKILRKDCTTLYYRLRWDRPGYTITTVYRNVSSGAFTHPDEDRALSHREAARIQSFPDDFQFFEKTVPQQIGNAVPPLLARALGLAVLVHIQMKKKRRFNLTALEKAVNDAVYQAAIPSSGAKMAKHLLERLTLEKSLQVDHVMSEGWKVLGSQVNPMALRSLLSLPRSASGANETSMPLILSALRLQHAVARAQTSALQPLLDAEPKLFREKKPARRRARAWTTHHFATVRYAIDPQTSCSDVSRPLMNKLV